MIDTLIFDMGNVLAHYTVEPVLEAICDDPQKIQWVVDHLFHSHLWHRLDEGTIDEDELYHAVADQTNDPSLYPLIKQGIVQWPKYNLTINSDMVPVVRYGLDHHMDLILLSNAPLRIHEVLDQYIPYIQRFKDLYISADLKMAKPDLRIFEYVLDHSDKKASQCLFIDDLKANCDAASSLGLTSWCYHNGDGSTIIEWLDQHR